MLKKMINLIRIIFGTLPAYITLIIITILSISIILFIPDKVRFMSDFFWMKIKISLFLMMMGSFGLVYWAKEEYPLLFTTIKGKFPRILGLIITLTMWSLVLLWLLFFQVF